MEKNTVILDIKDFLKLKDKEEVLRKIENDFKRENFALVYKEKVFRNNNPDTMMFVYTDNAVIDKLHGELNNTLNEIGKLKLELEDKGDAIHKGAKAVSDLYVVQGNLDRKTFELDVANKKIESETNDTLKSLAKMNYFGFRKWRKAARIALILKED